MRAEQSRAEQSRAEQSRISWLDILKGIGIFLVVLGHVYSEKTIFNWLYSFHMPLFFWAAGLTYKKRSVLTDINRRIQTIVGPYFSFGLLILIYWQIIERKFRDSDKSFMEALVGLVSGSYKNLDFNIHLWFLPCFFVTVVLFNLLVNIGGNKLAYIATILMSIVYVVIPMPELIWGINRVFMYIIFYSIGVALGEKIKISTLKKNKIEYLIAGILMTLNFILAYHGLTKGIMWFITALLGVMGVTIIAMLVNENRVLQYWGRISMVILCVHGPVYRIVIKVISILLNCSTETMRNKFFLSMLVVIITLMFCSVIYEVVVKVAPWMIGKNSFRIVINESKS